MLSGVSRLYCKLCESQEQGWQLSPAGRLRMLEEDGSRVTSRYRAAHQISIHEPR